VSPVQFAKALCDQKARYGLRFKEIKYLNCVMENQSTQESDQFFKKSKNDGDIESQTNPKQGLKNQNVDTNAYGTFAEGQMNGGIYRLQQGDSVYYTLFENERYIICE